MSLFKLIVNHLLLILVFYCPKQFKSQSLQTLAIGFQLKQQSGGLPPLIDFFSFAVNFFAPSNFKMFFNMVIVFINLVNTPII
jgi:hypothetical protein